MKIFKKSAIFILVISAILIAQAAGINYRQLYPQPSVSENSKSLQKVSLKNIEKGNIENINPDYVSIESNTVQIGGKQTVKVGLGVDLSDVDAASLKYEMEKSGSVLEQTTSDIKNGYITFTINTDKGTSLGTYKLLNVELKSQNGTKTADCSLKSLAVSYSVVNSLEETKLASTYAEEKPNTPAAMVSVQKDKTITSADIAEAVSVSKKAMQKETGSASSDEALSEYTVKAASNTGVTIVLDPGHGGYASGAVANGYLEKNLNLKIAKYAKQELETYAGVTVGLTRSDDTYLDLQQRADIGLQQGADILVSLHNNATGTEDTASGAEVYVSVLNAYNAASTVLGNIILDQLSALGLMDRGVKVRPSEAGTIFELTGELADYYGIIRNSAYNGFPGIIIEHCYMDNAADARDFLSSDTKLRELGVADAKALAEYYGLQKKNPLTGIEITTDPAKKLYYTGQSLDLTGMVVTGTHSDGTKSDVFVTRADVSGFDSSQPVKNQTVTITAEGKTAAFNVDIEPVITVLSGTDRFETSAKISEANMTAADTIILATGLDFPDALAAGPLATQKNAPILLTDTNSIPQATLEAIKSLKPANAIIMGSESKVGPAVVDTLNNLGISVKRVSGSNRFGTAVEAAKGVRSLSGVKDKAILVYGWNFPDALTIGSYASKEGIPILLTDSKVLTAETKAALLDFGIREVRIIGSTDAVGQGVENELKAMGINVLRNGGSNRFGTSVNIASNLFAGSQKALVAYGRNFPDALAAVPLAAKMNAPIILVEQGSLPTEVSSYINASMVECITVVGGDSAVGPAVKDGIVDVLPK